MGMYKTNTRFFEKVGALQSLCVNCILRGNNKGKTENTSSFRFIKYKELT